MIKQMVAQRDQEIARAIAEHLATSEAIRHVLVEKAPDGCLELLEPEGGMNVILAYGQLDTHFHDSDESDRGNYSFIGRTDLLQKLEVLKEAWEGLVDVQIKTNDQDDRIDVLFIGQ